jgi:hypothetical protein
LLAAAAAAAAAAFTFSLWFFSAFSFLAFALAARFLAAAARSFSAFSRSAFSLSARSALPSFFLDVVPDDDVEDEEDCCEDVDELAVGVGCTCWLEPEYCDEESGAGTACKCPSSDSWRNSLALAAEGYNTHTSNS